MNSNDLLGKVALVTGASRGIGRAIAVKLSLCGARVIINFHSDEDGAKKTIELMGDTGKNAKAFSFDVSDEMAVNSAIKEIGGVDILINNAGIAIDQLLLRMKTSDLDRQISVNLKSVFFCSKACSYHMIKNRWGRIINISSVVAEMGNAGQTAYAATKAGIIGFTKSLARELSGRNVLVNAITPGFIETDMTMGMAKKDSEAIIEQIPLRRLGDPREVANVVAFLASEEASYVTGQVWSVNGGMYI